MLARQIIRPFLLVVGVLICPVVFAGPLHEAAKTGNLRQARALIAQGAAVNAKDEGRTPLYWAAQEGHLAMVKLLIAHGADVNTVSKPDNSWTPLMLAAYRGYFGIAETLLRHGADPNAKNGRGQTALLLTYMDFSSRHLDVARLLIEKGARMSVRDVRTLPEVALRARDEDLLALLVRRGFNLDGVVPGLRVRGRSSSETLLLKAVDRGDLGAIKMLVTLGANPDKKGSGLVQLTTDWRRYTHYSNLTPLGLAELFERHLPGHRKEIVQYLRRVAAVGGSLVKVQAALEQYAADLRAAHREADAQRVAREAARFRTVIGAHESVYLGFDPSAVLRDYGGFLRKHGHDQKADDMDILSGWYFRTNLQKAREEAGQRRESN